MWVRLSSYHVLLALLIESKQKKTKHIKPSNQLDVYLFINVRGIFILFLQTKTARLLFVSCVFYFTNLQHRAEGKIRTDNDLLRKVNVTC